MVIKIKNASLPGWSRHAVKFTTLLIPCYLLILAAGIYLELERQHTIISEHNRALEYQFQQRYEQEQLSLVAIKDDVEQMLANRPPQLTLPENALRFADNLLAVYLIDNQQRLLPLYRTTGPDNKALPAAVIFDWLPHSIQHYVHSGKEVPIRGIRAGQHNELLRLKYYPLPQQDLSLLVVQGMADYMKAIDDLLPLNYQLLLSLDQLNLVIKSFEQYRYTLYDFVNTIHIEDQMPFSPQRIAAAKGRFLLDRDTIYFVEEITIRAKQLDGRYAINLTDHLGPTQHTAIYRLDWQTLLRQWPAKWGYLAALPLLVLLVVMLAIRQYYRRHDLQLLEAQHRKLEKAFDSIHGCIITDRWLQITHANRLARELWQLPEQQHALRSASSLFGYSELWLTLIRKARQGDHSPTAATIQRADGSMRQLQIQASGLFLGRRKFDGMVLCLNDVTEQHYSQQQQQIRATAFQSHEMVAITDAEANIIEINASFCRETGFSREELIGHSLFSLFSRYHSDDYLRFVKRTLGLHGYWEGEVFTRRKHGRHLCELRTITAIFDSQGNLSHYVSTGNNVSQRRQHELHAES